MRRRKSTLHEKAVEAGRAKNTHKKEYKYKHELEDSPEKEGIRKHYYRRGSYEKFEFRDKLGHLKRKIRSLVDRPWNQVRSKLYKELGEGLSAVHIKSHLKSYIELYPVYIDDQICYSEGFLRRYLPIRKGGFYIDEKGYLRVVKKDQRKKARTTDKYTRVVDNITLYTTKDGEFYVFSSPDDVKHKFLIRHNYGDMWIMVSYDEGMSFKQPKNEYHISRIAGPFKAYYD